MGIIEGQKQFFLDIIQTLKGHSPANWFNRLYFRFLDKKIYRCPETIQEVIQRLRAAWWVEEEDLLQQIHYIIVRCGLHERKMKTEWGWPDITYLRISPQLVNYIIYTVKAFQVRVDQEIPEPDMMDSITWVEFLSTLNNYEKRLVTLLFKEDLSQVEVCDILCLNEVTFWRDYTAIKDKARNYYSQ
jgi:hypothetical protein